MLPLLGTGPYKSTDLALEGWIIAVSGTQSSNYGSIAGRHHGNPFMKAISTRMQAIQTPVIPEIAALIRACPDTLSLGQGVVSYGPPQPAFDRIRDFGRQSVDHIYGPVHGITPLLEVIGAKLARENGIHCGEDTRVIVTAGSNMGFLQALLAICDPGDEVILPLPYYFNHEMAIGMLNCHPVPVPVDDDYQPDPARLEAAITPRTRAIVTISPNNPTGAVYDPQRLREINAICARHGIYHISDEAYEYFTYDGARHLSPGALEGASGHTISLFSLSKAYGFASWRIGYMVVPMVLFEPLLKAQDTNLICPPLIAQHAAIGALQTGVDYCRGHVQVLAGIRERIYARLQPLQGLCTFPRAYGAFYIFLKFNRDLDSMVVARQLIREFGVAVIPGNAFGLADDCYLRLSYGALREDRIDTGIQRLVDGLRSIAAPRQGLKMNYSAI